MHLPCDSQEAFDWFLKIHQSWQVFTRSAHSIKLIINPYKSTFSCLRHVSVSFGISKHNSRSTCPSASASFGNPPFVGSKSSPCSSSTGNRRIEGKGLPSENYYRHVFHHPKNMWKNMGSTSTVRYCLYMYMMISANLEKKLGWFPWKPIWYRKTIKNSSPGKMRSKSLKSAMVHAYFKHNSSWFPAKKNRPI